MQSVQETTESIMKIIKQNEAIGIPTAYFEIAKIIEILYKDFENKIKQNYINSNKEL